MTDEQITELFGEVPYFADQLIEQYRPHPDQDLFIVTSYWCDQASLNLLDVYGVTRPDYAGLTWREFLAKGRHMEANLYAFKKNPEYYTKHVYRLPSMFYRKTDGRTYVADDGNHRTCIGKFYLYVQGKPYIHGVRLEENIVDWRFLALYQRLKAVCPRDWRVKIVRTVVRREDGSGWKRDFFEIKASFIVHTHNAASDWMWTRDELEKELPALEFEASKQSVPARKKGFLSRIFGGKK
jgi:hypothetical protein